MARRRCPKCNRGTFGRYCSVCGTDAVPSSDAFLSHLSDRLGLTALARTVVTYIFVLIAPVRVAQESANGNRLIASPWQIFALNVVVSTAAFKLFIHDFILVAALAGDNPLGGLLVLKWGAWLPGAVLDALIRAAKSPADYMNQLRLLMNFMGAPVSFVIYAYIASWLAKRWKPALSTHEIYASVLISNSFCYFYFVVLFILGFYLVEPVILLLAFVVAFLGMPLLTVTSLRRVSAMTLWQAWRLTILSAILAAPLCYILFILIELLALIPSPIYDII